MASSLNVINAKLVFGMGSKQFSKFVGAAFITFDETV
jgi:hypothetical protein